MDVNNMDWKSIDDLEDIPAMPGLYWIRLKDPRLLSMIDVPESGLIYIGKSENLYDRESSQHFCTGRTGWSTLRRSIGALLKEEKGFTARPRRDSTNDRDCINYCFTGEDEKRLSCWMQKNLEISFCIVNRENLDTAEKAAIKAYKPVLCLTQWPNPQSDFIKGKRKICADEARRNRQIQIPGALSEADINE